MSAGSKIVFLTTRMALEFERIEYTEFAGYAGLKAAQTHLMIALAHHNDRGALVSSVSPHFQYDDRSKYEAVFRRVCDYILEFDQTQNGKIKVIQ
jgi:hypothetical protein